MNPSVVLYGIPNCDTVKKARIWLHAQGVDSQFHDFKKQGVPDAALDRWITQLGWEPLVNRAGTTWRKLEEVDRTAVMDAASARALMLAQPSVIKRPVVDWGEGAEPRYTVGFKPESFAARLGR